MVPRAARSAAYCVIAAWVLFGLFAHDPWKPDEAYTFGVVNEMAQTGKWVVPRLAGQPFMEKPPLFFGTAALFERAFGRLLPPPDAARLATALYVALTLAFSAFAARRLYGAAAGLACPLLLVGCLGYLQPAHLLLTDNALLAGLAIALCGFAVVLEQPGHGALLLGTGAGIAFLSKGLLGPGLIGLTALVLLALPAWCQAKYVRALAVAGLAFAPWAIVWPWLLYRHSPALFHQWLFVNNFGRFLGTAHVGPGPGHGLYLRILPWFAFPALPLAAWQLWREAKRGAKPWRAPQLQLPLVALAVMLAVLTAASDARELYAAPMLIPLALLAASGAQSWSPAFARSARSVSIAVGAFLLAALWAGWLVLVLKTPRAASAWLQASRPGFVAHPQPLAILLALVATAGWLHLLFSKTRPAEPPLAWAASLAAPWVLAMSLWLPYVDYGKSYRSEILALRTQLHPYPGCIAGRALGEPVRAMLDYFAGVVTRGSASTGPRRCKALLVQAGASEPRHPAGWALVWSGSRPGDTGERLWLFRPRSEPIRVAAAPR